MNSKIAAIVGAAAFAAMCQSQALATTYNYSGNLYTSNTDPGAAVLGTHLIGSITFDFDTSSFSGQIHQVDVSSLTMTSGTLSWSLPSFSNTQFDLSNGVVTDWQIIGNAVDTGPVAGSSGNVLGPPFGFQQNSVQYFANGIFTGQVAFDSCSINTNAGCVLQGWSEVIAASTPLPATWLMLFSGLVGLGFFARRGTARFAAVAAPAA